MVFLKSLYIVIFVCIAYTLFGSMNHEKIVIPDNAIRFRVIASSNSEPDQKLKMKVKLAIERKLSNILKNVDNIDSVNIAILNNLKTLENDVISVLKEENSIETFKINFGNNYFPEKEYNGIKYNEGGYNSLTITLGNGLGSNWWCILFPPLCLLDEQNYAETEYKFYVKEILNDYLK